ncbi:DUF262 domain-containing protein [Flavobacterium aquicola]|uniref:Uncharacterized protein DUF262 n=1 Tax=Flavobacterium aquicola TaxID=1682742 RepID=A0A3E0ENG7_9FLAO|nr:DUF262 domain-containing protein [Flavobacterium aquicola]REG99804.1 uncharacterized protein DUF262 [Flavobacterium aquicola]
MGSIKNGEYSIKELFCTDYRKIIIPDFQRDYCWGNKHYGEKKDINIVAGFIDTLLEEKNKGKTILGKIDVYENPKNHIYLTDGQQRLTTIYLLIGMLYRKASAEQKIELKKCLLSEFEEKDDKEPYLQYSIRESSVFFLRDLVNEFFIGNTDLQVKDIEKQPWHFDEYSLDPTIQSFKEALNTIEDKLKNRKENEIDIFSKFILEDIKIQYHDVSDRKHGEERFVIINTTGKGLTTTENIKPIFLGTVENVCFAEQWEERETFFWKNRIKEKESTADNGVNDFMTWCFQIIEIQEEIDLVKITKRILKDNENEKILFKINDLFEAYKKLLGLIESSKIQKQLNFINGGAVYNIRLLTKDRINEIILPLLLFITEISDEKTDVYQFLRRLRKNYFDKKWEERKQNYTDWRYIIQLIDKSKNIEDLLSFKDVFNFKDIPNVPNNIKNWFNIEEQLKANLKILNEELIEKIEDHQDFMGDLSFFLFKVHKIETEISCADIRKYFDNYKDTIDRIRKKYIEEKPILTNYLRLLLIMNNCNEVGHIRRASWEFEGVLFSLINNRNHLNTEDFKELCSLDNNERILIDFCKNKIFGKAENDEIFKLDEFSTEKFIKGWLILKVVNAENENVCLAFYDGNETGVSAYVDKNSNRLITTEDFSWGNSICGFGVRSGFGSGNYVHYTNNDFWLNPKIIDTPFSEIAFDKKNRTKEQIKKNNEKISELIEIIYNRHELSKNDTEKKVYNDIGSLNLR